MAGRRERQQDGGFALRLRQIVEGYGSASALAKKIQRSEGAVRKWLRGESEPNVTDLRSVCEETHTSIEWLVTGRGQREATLKVQEQAATYRSRGQEPLDHALLERIIRAVEEELRGAGLSLPATKRSMLVVTLYALCQERREVDHEAVARLVKLAG
jgi:transcriptional regulator with XRE-family HTH domain